MGMSKFAILNSISMKSISSLSLAGKKVLVRVDFNVPLTADFQVSDDTRLRATLPTIHHILEAGASLVLMSHLGRPKVGPTDKYSLRHIVPALEKLIGKPVQFANDCIGAEASEKAAALQPGEILLLENLRFYKEEEKGDIGFAEKLSKLGNVYVNDAFGTAHRAHASTAVMAQFFSEKAAGFVMAAEIENAKKVLDSAQKPYVAIMGGAKVSDKILIIENLLDRIDHLIIGGGMAYTFWKAKGGVIGNSLLEEDRLETCLRILELAKEKGVEVHLPMDSTIADAFSNEAQKTNCESKEIPAGWMGLDIGQKAMQDFREVVLKCKTILWNGPMGVFEMPAFAEGTKTIAHAVVKATANGAYSLIGGGDSAAAVNQLGFGDQVSYVSTGGGALLEYMEGKVLPGVAALGE
jgi:phosphoglycerate kinase